MTAELLVVENAQETDVATPERGGPRLERLAVGTVPGQRQGDTQAPALELGHRPQQGLDALHRLHQTADEEQARRAEAELIAQRPLPRQVLFGPATK